MNVIAQRVEALRSNVSWGTAQLHKTLPVTMEYWGSDAPRPSPFRYLTALHSDAPAAKSWC